jgi:hypothetical protein
MKNIELEDKNKILLLQERIKVAKFGKGFDDLIYMKEVGKPMNSLAYKRDLMYCTWSCIHSVFDHKNK